MVYCIFLMDHWNFTAMPIGLEVIFGNQSQFPCADLLFNHRFCCFEFFKKIFLKKLNGWRYWFFNDI